MGNIASTSYGHIQLLLEKLPYAGGLQSMTRKDVSIAAVAVLGVYFGGLFISKCYQAHRIRTMLRDIPNPPSVISGNLNDVSIVKF